MHNFLKMHFSLKIEHFSLYFLENELKFQIPLFLGKPFKD